MISYRMITVILILVVTLGFVEGCYFKSSCELAYENCTELVNATLLCHCVDAEDTHCLFDQCSSELDCGSHGYCYRQKINGTNNSRVKCLCDRGYSGMTCDQDLQATSTSTLQPVLQTTSNEVTISISTTEFTEGDPESETTSVSPLPIFDIPKPDYGPFAGGTKVTITGQYLEQIDKIYLRGAVENQEWNETVSTILIETPPYNASDERSQKFRYSLRVQTDEKTDAGVYFKYKPNPTVSDIFPKKAIISGGTSVTVTGTNFDSVASPKFKVYVSDRRNDDKDNATRIFKKTCKHMDDTQLLCRFPNITSELGNLSLRRKRFVGKENNLVLRKIREAPTTDQLQFTLGLEFDGADYYEDLADSNPRLGFIDVHPDPIFQSDQAILFDPAVAKVIGIKGEDIDLGTVVEDYRVYIGDAMCTDIGLTFDKLYCSPPENIDDIKDRGSDRRPNEANVTVHIGINLRHYVGFITYNTEDPTVPLYTLFIPVVAAIGGVLLILFIILIVCACRKSDAKDEPLTAPSVTDIDNMAPTGNDNYYTGQTAPKDQYYMVVNKDDRRKGSLPPPDKNAVDGRI